MTNRSGTLYIGVTNDIFRRVLEHKTGVTPGFTSRYLMTHLLYVEATNDISAAIQREKQLKGWLRKRKLELVRNQNPYWTDLNEGWYEKTPVSPIVEGQILRSAQNDNGKTAGLLTKDNDHV
jgi:putative endonuclease